MLQLVRNMRGEAGVTVELRSDFEKICAMASRVKIDCMVLANASILQPIFLFFHGFFLWILMIKLIPPKLRSSLRVGYLCYFHGNLRPPTPPNATSPRNSERNLRSLKAPRRQGKSCQEAQKDGGFPAQKRSKGAKGQETFEEPHGVLQSICILDRHNKKLASGCKPEVT